MSNVARESERGLSEGPRPLKIKVHPCALCRRKVYAPVWLVAGMAVLATLGSLSAAGKRYKEPFGVGDFQWTGVASWYAESKKTASGERYDASALTAAHRTLPFGTIVEVKNLQSGCSAVVRITDRGPFTKGRIIDVSRAAAKQLQMMNSGVAKVELVVLE